MPIVSSLDVTANVTSSSLSILTGTLPSVASCTSTSVVNSLASKVAGLRTVMVSPTPATNSEE